MLLIGQKKFLGSTKLKTKFHGLVISDVNGDEIVGTFYEKELQTTNQEEFRIGKVIKRKGNKLYVKWKGNDNSFNWWINKNTLYKYS